MHTQQHTHFCTSIQTIIYTHKHTHLRASIHTLTHTHTHTYVHTYIYIHTYVNAHLRTSIHTHTNINTYMTKTCLWKHRPVKETCTRDLQKRHATKTSILANVPGDWQWINLKDSPKDIQRGPCEHAKQKRNTQKTRKTYFPAKRYIHSRQHTWR